MTTRISRLNDEQPRDGGQYVLYWMVMNRRPHWNFALDRAIELASEHGLPLIVLEALRCGYQWASDRHHAFVLQGMADNREAFKGSAIRYYPYVEPEAGAGKGLLAALAEQARVVVTDDYPCFMIPRMQAAAARQVGCAMEAVDSNGLLPIRTTDREFTRAHSFRRYLHKVLPEYIAERPLSNPLAGLELREAHVPADILERWPEARKAVLDADPDALAELPIDHDVGVVDYRGGHRAGSDRAREFVSEGLSSYGDDRNQPQRDGTSRLSPYLHFGHVSSHEVFHLIAEQEDWSPQRLAEKPTGKREGWWGMSAPAEAYLDELVTWREVGFNTCVVRDDYDRYESLPDWALTTLEEHADDEREYCYSLEDFERGRTHDELWNAAQMQLVREGRIHNYLRMLWGKKILHWTESPRQALDIMLELNNKYAVDGRDPNSYSGIFWVLGRFDRAWGPEREIFGKIRYMTSASTRRKLEVDGYIEQYAPGLQTSLAL